MDEQPSLKFTSHNFILAFILPRSMYCYLEQMMAQEKILYFLLLLGLQKTLIQCFRNKLLQASYCCKERGMGAGGLQKQLVFSAIQVYKCGSRISKRKKDGTVSLSSKAHLCSFQVFRLQVNNGIPIKSWIDDPLDSALISLLPFLETLVDVDDVRPIIAQRFGNKE